ncbi:MAG: prepilin-type N-terminal cleavage/methylation domain-containing protein, partial [Deltaproteobacteria bacterium]|nr:prepilin-type N-terminal cleavage/methylation domain-containing protein [Deltaproteobacteria bacterium]
MKMLLGTWVPRSTLPARPKTGRVDDAFIRIELMADGCRRDHRHLWRGCSARSDARRDVLKPVASLRRGAIKDQGMTLVELMISMLLAAILSAGLFYMTSGQQRVYTSQLDTMQLQEGLWGAMEYVKRQVRLAGRGFGGCLRGRVYDGDPDVPQNAVIYGLRVFNGCNLSTDPVLDNSSLVDRCATSNSSHSDSFAVTMRDTRDNPPLQVMRSGAAKQMDLAVVNTLGFLPGDQVIVYPFGDSMRPCVLREITGTSPPVPPSLYPLLNTKSPNGRGDPTIGYPVGSLVIDVGSVSSPLTPAVPLAPRYFAIDHSKN